MRVASLVLPRQREDTVLRKVPTFCFHGSLCTGQLCDLIYGFALGGENFHLLAQLSPAIVLVMAHHVSPLLETELQVSSLVLKLHMSMISSLVHPFLVLLQ